MKEVGLLAPLAAFLLLNMTKIALPSEFHSNKSLQNENGNTYALYTLEFK